MIKGELFKEFRLTQSLRGQVALLIAGLSFLPNAALIFATLGLYPNVRALPKWFLMGVVVWLTTAGILSAIVGYWASHFLVRPLTLLAKELSLLESVLGQPEQWTLTVRPQDPREAIILRGAFGRLLHQVKLEQERRAAFTATLVHDLKTPLIAFHHLLVALKDNPQLTPDQRHDILSQLLQEDERILELVKKMVDVHRLEQGDITLDRSDCDLKLLAQSLVTRLQPIATERGLKLSVQGSGTACVDRPELERALYNLMDNALRYAQSQVRILVHAESIQVSDDGPGLPAPLDQLAQPYTAEPFIVAGQRYTARSSGLGLFIARRILEAHSGYIEVVQSDPSGTTLRLVWGLSSEVSVKDPVDSLLNADAETQ